MNPQLANFMLARTPESIKHPEISPETMTGQSFTLNTGAKIPALALGTWQSDPGQVKTAVATALKLGYRHVDGAFVYGNENEVGEGLKEAFASGVKREDIFVTSKCMSVLVRIRKLRSSISNVCEKNAGFLFSTGIAK
jgi:glycerol 2-dehydrogenase (NADP+)